MWRRVLLALIWFTRRRYVCVCAHWPLMVKCKTFTFYHPERNKSPIRTRHSSLFVLLSFNHSCYFCICHQWTFKVKCSLTPFTVKLPRQHESRVLLQRVLTIFVLLVSVTPFYCFTFAIAGLSRVNDKPQMSRQDKWMLITNCGIT